MKTDIVVVGNGPTARLVFLALNGLGLEVVAVAPADDRRSDPRTTALMPSSVHALDRLGIDVRPRSTALTGLVVETTGPLGLVSERFTADDAGEPFLAQNLFVADLMALMPIADPVDSDAAALAFEATRTTVLTADGDRIEARLVVAADGVGSTMREQAGITLRRRTLDRHAYCAPAELERPHAGLCIERYDDIGTVTVIPVGERDASLITIVEPGQANALAALDGAAAGAWLSRRQPAYGAIRIAGRPALFPLSIGWAPEPARNRVVVVGEAAHVAPPIGAQGWNMAVADIMALRAVLQSAQAAGIDIGSPRSLDAYARRRRPDLAGRMSAIGMLAGIATRSDGPVGLMRQAGLLALSGFGGAKRKLMRTGLR